MFLNILIINNLICQQYNMKTKQTLFSKISNNVFLIITIFTLTLIWINYYIHNLTTSILASTIIIICVCIVIYSYKYITQKKAKSINLINNEKDILKNHMIFSSNWENFQTISSVFALNEATPTNEKNHYTTPEKDIFILLNSENISKESIENCLKNREHNKLDIYCTNCSEVPLIDNLEINIITFDEIFEKIHSSNNQPFQYYRLLKTPKLRLSSILRIILSKDRSRGYLGFGILVMISSLFSPFHNYYIIIGTMLLLLAIYSRFNKHFN